MGFNVEHFQILRDRHGIDGGRLQNRGLGNQVDLSDDLLAGRDPADTHAGREDLGEGAEVHDQFLRIHALKRREVLALEPKVSIGVVLNGGNLILIDDIHELLSALQRPGASARVLEIGDDIDELDILRGGKDTVQFFHDHAIFIRRNLDKLRLILPESIDRAKIARALQNDDVAGIQEELADEVQALLAAGGQDNLCRIDGDIVLFQHALGDLLSQRSPAVGRTVLQCRRSGFFQYCVIGFSDILDREQLGGRQAARE